jgi:hypothetical protein
MEITREHKVSQIEKVVNSRVLHGSETLRAFLRFIGNEAIEGHENRLKEYVIATEVFGRGTDFDSRVDSVVRVQAGRLRTKLLEYYTSEGKSDQVVINLPKGHYIPVFSLVPEAIAAFAPTAESDREVKNGPLGVQANIVTPLWNDYLSSTEPALVVFSNTIFYGTYENGMKLYNSLNVQEGENSATMLSVGIGGNHKNDLPMIDHYTGIGELMGVQLLSDFFHRHRHPYRIKRSLTLNWDDAKTANIIVLGSPAENLFLLDLPQKQDFVFRWLRGEDGRHVNAVLNTRPQPGEEEYYLAKQIDLSPSHIVEDYAVISFIRGLSEENRLMILAGINTFGTQAAAEYVTKTEYTKDLISHLNLATADEPPRLPGCYQILIRVKVSGGVPIQISYVTHHVLDN